MIKNICCIGAGYVGGPTMAVIAEMSPNINVTLVDSNREKINLWNGDINKLPVFEPGLKEIVSKVRNKNLFFSSEIEKNIIKADMIFIAVNTPTKTEGEGAGMAADLKYVIACAKQIAKVATSDKIIIEKSTLPVRTAEKIKEILSNEAKSGVRFEVLSNPEFLAEGTAIKDLYKSDRVLIGGDKTESGRYAVNQLVNIYKKWIPQSKILTTNVWSSELAKLASNAMLAQRISSINSLSALSKVTEADIDEVSEAIGMDSRIGKRFLKVSPGFGGSCFQKDILNLVYLFRHYGLDDQADYWHSVIKINDSQRRRVSDILISYCKENKLDKKVALLGWSFKKNTNDTRESSSIYIAYDLICSGFKITIYDPQVKHAKIIKDLTSLNSSRSMISDDIIQESIIYKDNFEELIVSANIIAILTEWDEFIKIEKYSDKKIFDFRNFIDKDKTTFHF